MHIGSSSGFFQLPFHNKDAKVALFGAPYDGTCCGRPGSRFGPAHIRLRAEDLESYSPYQDDDIEDYQGIDIGDLALPFGDKETALRLIREKTKELLEQDLIPFMLGGEHLCTLPAFQSTFEKYPDLHILQLDAHTDLRSDYMGVTLSHASVMWHILEILQDPKKVISYGLRSGLKKEFDLAKKCRFCGPFPSTSTQRIESLKGHLKQIGDAPLYLTLDIDLFDPAIMPGTGTPEPGGIFFDEFAQLLPLLKKSNIVALDLVELSPEVDSTSCSTLLAVKLVRELLLLLKDEKKVL